MDLHNQYPLRVVATNGKILERSGWAFFAWQAGLDIALARTMEQGELPRVWLKDWWSPMHIRFGMLLGYPGMAIETFVDAESERHPEDLIDVLVAEGRFNSADIAFGVREDERNHEDVVRTVEIWKATLRQVYAVYPEEALMTNADFRRAAEAKR